MKTVPVGIASLSPGQMSERSGVAVSALHFYERKGLISSERTDGNQRRYRREMLRRVAFIRASQRVGLTLERIEQAMAHLPADRAPSKQDWERLSRAWRSELDSRIEHLMRLRDGLTSCIGCGCLSLQVCALSNPDDQFAATHTEPSRL